MLATFTGAEEKLTAAVALFGRLADATQLRTLLLAMDDEQRRLLHQRLGILAFFNASNPTGRCGPQTMYKRSTTALLKSIPLFSPTLYRTVYCLPAFPPHSTYTRRSGSHTPVAHPCRYSLDMSKPIHRVVLSRLLHLSAVAETWSQGPMLHNFRNVLVNRVETRLGDPSRFRLPAGGWIQLDFLEYTPTILCPSAIEPEMDIVVRRKMLKEVLVDKLDGNTAEVEQAAPADIVAVSALLHAFVQRRHVEQERAWQEERAAIMGAAVKQRPKRKSGKPGKKEKVAWKKAAITSKTSPRVRG